MTRLTSFTAAMSAYGVGLIPLHDILSCGDVDPAWKQVAFADDLSGVGKLVFLRVWWDLVMKYGPILGYYPNASKSWLTVKGEHFDIATEMFKGTGINITKHGRKHLGAVIGSEDYKKEYVKEKVNDWVTSLKKLANIAKTQPQAAYTCYVKGFSHKYTYFMRTIPNISELLKPLDRAIDELIKIIFDNYDFNINERKLWSLPVRMGGLGLFIPSEISDEQYRNSRLINEKLTLKVINQDKVYEDIKAAVTAAKSTVKSLKNDHYQKILDEVSSQIQDESKAKALEASQEKGASSWLNVLPLKSLNYSLDKDSFRVALFIRYGLPIKRLPSICVCGSKFSVEHALNCKKGGFITSRHNELRQITAEFLKEVCLDVEEEPLLQEITGEVFKSKATKTEKDTRLDMAAKSFGYGGKGRFGI